MGKKMKRILALCLCMLMVLTVVPKHVFAAENDDSITASETDAEIYEETEVVEGEAYDVWVSGVLIQTSNKDDVLGNGSVRFEVGSDGEPDKLYLKNANIENYTSKNYTYAAIYAKDDLDIYLEGDNYIGNPVDDISKLKDAVIEIGVFACADDNEFKNIAFYGNGNLTMNYADVGVWANSIYINIGGELKASEYGEMPKACCLKATGTNSKVVISKGKLTLRSYTSKCVSGNLRIYGGSLDMYSYGALESTNTALDQNPEYGIKYHPVITYGDSPESCTVTYDEYGDDYPTAKYINISHDSRPYRVYTSTLAGGKITTNQVYANQGDGITISIKPDPGYMLSDISVSDADDNSVFLTNSYTFTMPASDVTINCSFKLIPTMDPIDPLGISIMHNDARGIEAFLMTSGSVNYSTFEIAWYYSNDGGISYTELSDFQYSNAIIDFPTQKLNYLIVAKTRVNRDDSTIRYASYSVDANVGIKGICQMPNPGGSGYLIGIETKYDPDNEYTVEMLILDCSLLAKGEDAWVYTTGRCGTTDNCLWTVWDPQYGYYWTLFRVYDRNGNLVEEQCYGFENI